MGSFNRRQEADDLTDYVNNGWLSSAEFDGPTFLWNHLIREASQEDAAQRNDVPVANLSDADVVINMPMQWYFDALASMVPTAERTDTGVEIPRIDMPTFSIDSQALSGVDAVVGNAVISTRWLDAVGNLAKAVEMTARFVGNVADRDNRGFRLPERSDSDRTRVHGCRGLQRRSDDGRAGVAHDHAGGVQ